MVVEINVSRIEEKLLHASFRGVPFYVSSDNMEIGQRLAIHEYPQRSTPYVEVLGRKARVIKLNAYVVGLDFDVQRENLLKVLDQPGIGVLVSPWNGEMTVAFQSGGVVQEDKTLRMVKFELTFVEAGVRKYPVGATSTPSNTNAKAATTRTAAISDLAAAFKFISDLPNTIMAAIAPVVATLQGLTNTVLDVADYASNLVLFAENLPYSLASALGLGSLLGLVMSFLDAGNNSSDDNGFSAGIDLTNYYNGNVAPLGITPRRIQEAQNIQAFNRFVAVNGIVTAATASAATTYTCSADAYAAMNQITDAIDNILFVDNDISDPLFTALRDLRAAAVLDLQTRAAQAPSLITFTSNQPLPAFVVAWRQYQDATRADEIVARNNPQNPLFMPTTLELLSV